MVSLRIQVVCVRITEPEEVVPAAMQSVVVGHAMPPTSSTVDGTRWRTHVVPPFVVCTTAPANPELVTPPAKQ
jgi:hypothetical protein